jgi:tetratricopeptide (TPR) repeat protein
MYSRPPEDDDDEGKIRSNAEFLAVLENRADIFFIESGTRLHAVEALALVIGVIFGIVLCTMPMRKVAPGFYRNSQKERIARLWRGPNQSLTKRISPTEEIGAGTSGGTESKTVSIAEYARASQRSAVLPTQVKVRGIRSPVESTAKGNDSLARRENPKKAEDEANLISFGNANKTKGNRADAFAAFRRVLDQDPHNTAALAGMGDLFLYTGLLDSAVDFYRAAIAVNPHVAAYHNGLASARYYISTFAANPHFAARRKILNPAQYIKSQYDSAIAEYTNAISLDSSCVDALTNRGVLRDIRDDFQGALKDYTLAIRINPSWADAYAKRAATYKTLGDYKDAINDYTAAIKLDSSSYTFDPTLRFANAYFGRGIVYYKMGDHERAIMDFDSTLILSPNHSLAILNKAITLGDARRYDSAIVWYTKAIALLSPMEYSGAQEHAYFGRGLMYNLTNQVDSALKDFNQALRLRPDDRYAYLHRGNALMIQKKYDEAIADYKNALVFPPLAAKSCWRIAECFSLKQDREDAVAWLGRAVQNGFKDFAAWKRDKSLSILWNDKEFMALTK